MNIFININITKKNKVEGFESLKKLGDGSYSVVYKVRSKATTIYTH